MKTNHQKACFKLILCTTELVKTSHSSFFFLFLAESNIRCTKFAAVWCQKKIVQISKEAKGDENRNMNNRGRKGAVQGVHCHRLMFGPAMCGNLSRLTDCVIGQIGRVVVAGWLSASFFSSSLSLFMACGIMNLMNYPESDARGCGSLRTSWTEPSLSTAFFCTRPNVHKHPHT